MGIDRAFYNTPLQVEDFVKQVGPDGLYGYQLDTVNSLILSLLPPVDFKFHCDKEQSFVDTSEDIKLFILRLLVQYIRRCSGFHIPFVRLHLYTAWKAYFSFITMLTQQVLFT